MPKRDRAAIAEAIDALKVLYSEKEEAMRNVDAYEGASPGTAEYDTFLAGGSHVGAKRLCQSMVRPRTHTAYSPLVLSVIAPHASGYGVETPPSEH